MAVTKLDYQQVLQQSYDEDAQALRTTGGGGGGSDVTIVADEAGLAKESTLSSLNGKVTAVNTGAVVVASSALPTGAATETTLASLNGKVVAVNTGAVVVSSSALPTGAATETTLSSLNTKVTAVNTGAVTISTALPAGTNSIGTVVTAKQNVIDFLDVPVLIASTTSIPGSAGNPVQVVATLAAATSGIKVNDTIGEFVGVYRGAALSEVLVCIVGPGEDGIIPVSIASGQRVSLRNMGSATLIAGSLCIQFLG